jgi:hypothetical protein
MPLDDHKKVGRKLIPPMLASGHPITQTNWQIDRQPQLFWIASLIRQIGFDVTYDAIVDMANDIDNAIETCRGSRAIVRSYLLSEHSKLTAAEKQAILESGRDSSWFKQISPTIGELTSLIPELPANYLGIQTARNKSQILEELKLTLSECDHRHELLALQAQSVALGAEFATGHCSIAEGLTLPDFKDICDYPNTEDSKRAAGFIVTSCNLMVMGVPQENGPDFTWQRTFWNACYSLDDCLYD